MSSPATLTAAISPGAGEPPWPGQEYVRGWGVFGLPFDSGHVLALRVFPQGSFGSYRTVWHRDPDGRWAIHADAPRVDLACPRYYGAACDHVGPARIGLEWTGPRELRVTMDEPALSWTVVAARSPVMGLLNPASARLPLVSWRPTALVRARELLARSLGMGRLLLQRCLAAAAQLGYRRCYLETLVRMTAARAMYESAGFRKLPSPMGDTGHHRCDAWYVKELQ